MACGCASLAAYPRLIVLAVGLPVVEALLLGAAGASDAQALAPQTSAPAPFGVFHDLRWLLVFHSSWLAFGIEMAALIVVRTAITALLVPPRGRSAGNLRHRCRWRPGARRSPS